MKVYGFVGPSGTGKSHRSTWVSRENGLDFIIDDGLLIGNSSIAAGISAKKEPTKIGSIKRALFQDDNHVSLVREAIQRLQPKGILILGTSDGMVETIAKRLGIEPIEKKIYIHEVASEFEIKQAIATRKNQGKHVIPVPTVELKKDFSGYFLDPLQIFRRRGTGSYQLVGEKSVVRPTFSYLGKFTISDFTIYQIVEHETVRMKGIHKISRFRADNRPDGVYIEMDLVLTYGYAIRPLFKDVMRQVSEVLERLTGLQVISMNLYAKSLVLPDQNEKAGG